MKITNYQNAYIPINTKRKESPDVSSSQQTDRETGYAANSMNTQSYLAFIPNVHHHKVSFGALKKNQFDGIDFAVVEKFKAPIEKFNANSDLQDWAKGQAESIANTDFDGRQQETRIQRKAMLKEWTDYIFKENDAYNSATALLILNAITKDLKPDNDKLPPVLNKGVLADCISEIDKNTKADKKYQFDLNKMYETKLRAIYLEDAKTENGNTGWVVIPSKINDPEHFEQNVEKLKTLSHKNWCTKSFNAEPYLSQGDFHVYLENGQPKLGVRFVLDRIQEIQGEKNNGKIPIGYFEEVKDHIKDNGLKLGQNAKEEIEAAKKFKKKIDRIKKDLKDAIKNKDVRAIFEYFGLIEEKSLTLWEKIFKSQKNKDTELLEIFTYRQPSKGFTFSDLGIDEDMLFERVKSVKGIADFRNSQVTNLGNLESIGSHADFSDSRVTSLGNLESIGGHANFQNSKVTSLGNLESIGGNADFSDSQVTSLGYLESIGGHVDFSGSRVTSLGNLKSIGGHAHFDNSKVTSLGKLKSIGGNANFCNSQVIDLGNLKSIGDSADFKYSKVTSLENLESIGGHADFRSSRVADLGNLKSIGHSTEFANSQITSLGNLESIGDFADFQNSKVTSLGNLESIGGDADFRNSQVEDLGKLQSIGGFLFIDDCKLTATDFKNIKVKMSEKNS